MKKQKHYDFYVQCMQSGHLPNKHETLPTGLCGAAAYFQISSGILQLFEPTDENYNELSANDQCIGWWGYEGPAFSYEHSAERRYGFNTLRQTIVLFMACVAGEKF